jgi:hypothetical protein
MKKGKDTLALLFAAARQAPGCEIGPMRGSMKARVLANWGGEAMELQFYHALAVLFQRALACAAVLMLATIIWSLQNSSAEPLNDEALANYELRADVMP